MLPSEPSRPLTPEEEAALAAIVAETGPPPQPSYIPESSAPPPTAAPVPAEAGFDLMKNGSQGPFTTPTGWQHGGLGTGGGKAGGMLTSYPGGGAGGLSFSQLEGSEPLRLTDTSAADSQAMGATAGGGSLLNPSYVPREQGPGMYTPRYTGPGSATQLPPYQPPSSGPPVTEPGMYEGRYERPGQAVPTTVPTEPGMYEPRYAQPGYYAPRAPSTSYGGDVWPTPYTGTERAHNIGTMQAGPRRDMVQAITPATGETTYRTVPDLGTAEVVLPGPIRYTDSNPDPSLTNRGQIFGGNAPPTPTVTLGPTSSQMGYLASQGDPRVTRAADGRLVLTKDFNPRPSISRRLGGLFGGTAARTVPGRYQPLPVPKGG